MRFYSLLLAICIACGCSASRKKDLTPRFTVEAGTQPTFLRSVGAELDAHFHAHHCFRSAGSKSEDWEKVVVPRIKKMGISSLRVMVLPNWYEINNDDDDPQHIEWRGFNFQSDEMLGLYEVLDLAEELQIPVTLVPWGTLSGYFMAPGNPGWVVKPQLLDEYAENITALMIYLIGQKQYTCIQELTPGNEPDGWGIEPSYYIELCKQLHTRLDQEGMLGRFHLALVDNTDQGGKFDFLKDCTEGLQGIADVCVSHTYIFGYETPSADITAWEQQNCQLAHSIGKPHFVGEFGSNRCVGASRQLDIDDYRRGILIVRNALAFLAGGASGISYWQLFDQYYSRTDSYESMQQLGLWKSVKKDYASEPYYSELRCDYQPRPQYFAYSLLSRFLRPGAQVYAMQPNETAAQMTLSNALCVQNTDGSWVYVVANLENEDAQICLQNEVFPLQGSFLRYVYSEDRLPSDDSMLEADSEQVLANGNLQLTVPSNTVVLFRSIQ